MRARVADAEGHVDVDGVTIGYEVHGDGSPTVALLPTWTIVHNRIWKAQVAYLARHHRVVVFDAPGNGRSDRTLDPGPYRTEAVAAATVAVMDATDTPTAVLVSLSKGANWSLRVAVDHPSRVLGQAFIGPTANLTPVSAERAGIDGAFFDHVDDPQGWQKYNAHYWLQHYDDFATFFFSQCFPERHSTKQREDAVGWALETTPQILLAEATAPEPDRDTVLGWCAAVDGPVLVIHGDRDLISPLARGEVLARATGGELVVLSGAGHIPLARDPVKVNMLLHQFTERCAP